MKRRTGYRPDPAGHRKTPFHHLAARFGSPALPLAALDLLARAPDVMDQGASGACVGHATSCAIKAHLGDALPFVPSPHGIYTLARCIDRPTPTTPLADDGCEPNQAVRGIEEWGVHPIDAPTPDGRYSDVDDGNVNLEPQLGELEEDAHHLVVGAYAIASDLSVSVRQALANGCPVTVAVAGGSDAFQGYAGGVIERLPGQLDHYTTLLGFETAPDGSTVFHGRNSWGKGWGAGGSFLLRDTALADLGDFYAFAVEVHS